MKFNFLKSKLAKVCVGSAAAISCVAGSVITSNAAYNVQPIPSAQPIDFTAVGDLWSFGASMMQDVLAIISNQPILVAIVFALPLVGLGIGLFKRLVS